MQAFDPLIAADVPRWVLAALLMAAFVGVTLATILLIRYPIRHAPSPLPNEKDRANSDAD